MGRVTVRKITVRSGSIGTPCDTTIGAPVKGLVKIRGEEDISSSHCLCPSGQFRLGIGPGLDGGEDGVIAVGGHPDLVPREGDGIDLTVRVVAL